MESEPYKTDVGIGWVIAEDDDVLMKRRMLTMEQEQSRA